MSPGSWVCETAPEHPARWAWHRGARPSPSPMSPWDALPTCPPEWAQRTIVPTAPDLGQDHCRDADGGFLQMLMGRLGAGRSDVAAG